MKKDLGTIRLMTEVSTPLQSVGVLAKQSIPSTSMLRKGTQQQRDTRRDDDGQGGECSTKWVTGGREGCRTEWAEEWRQWDEEGNERTATPKVSGREKKKEGEGGSNDISHAISRLRVKEKGKKALTMVASAGGCVGQGPRHKYTHTYANTRVRCRSTCKRGTTGGVTVQGTRGEEATE